MHYSASGPYLPLFNVRTQGSARRDRHRVQGYPSAVYTVVQHTVDNMQAESEGQQPQSQGPNVEAVAVVGVADQDHENNPGLITVYESDEVLHDALGQPGAPVAQGATPATSAEAFKEFIFQTILGTPVALDDNCVVKSTVGGVSTLFPTLFHRLTHNQLYRILAHLPWNGSNSEGGKTNLC